MVATLVARNQNESIVSSMVGSEGVCLEGIWSQVVGFVMVAWQDCGYSRRKGVFTLNLLKKYILYI
jgi:hypothetical protein